MSIFKRPVEKPELQEAIDRLVTSVSDDSVSVEEFNQNLDRLTQLYMLQNTTSAKRVSPDTMAIVLGNLLGILIIVKHERVHVITSKALAFAGRLK